MTPSIGAQGSAALDKWLDDAVASGTVPALFVGVATQDDILYFNCKGERVLGEPDKGDVNDDTLVQLWSMTKLVTCIACLQLRERGLVDFDDASLIDRVLPEIAAVPILLSYKDDKPVYTQRTEPITLRRLLTHTVGHSYGDSSLQRWESENVKVRWRAANATIESFVAPLMCQPGTRFVYGLAIDWAGIIVQRVTGQTLDAYFKENIWQPLGLKSFTFLPGEDVSRQMRMCTRDKDGNLIHIPKAYGIPNVRPEDVGVHAGGGGLVGTMKEYLVFLQHVLKCRDTPGIITPSSFRELFTDSLPPRDATHDCQRTLGSFLKMRGYREKQYTSGDKVGYSTGLCLNLADSANGRKAGSGFWFGAARSEFWIDPASGIVGLCATQLMNDRETLWDGVYSSYERTVYDALEGIDSARL